MAHSVTECKDMIRASHESNRLLAIGHQRHYSVLYDNANYLVQNGFLGDIRHIRALWHRNNATPTIAKNSDGTLKYDAQGNPEYVRDQDGNIVYFDSWKPPIPEEDKKVDFAKYGYKSLDELIRWRLYDRTGAGLMAELGSHQLDACSIFLGKKHPLAVTGIGGTFFYTDGREVDDHVFVSFEFPGYEQDNKKERVVVTYSSITTNQFENYGEEVMGTRGTMFVEAEREVLVFKEPDRNARKVSPSRATNVTVERTQAGKAVMETSPSAAGPSAASSLGGLATADPSKGYREELEHFAYCIRNGNPSDYCNDEEHRPRCRGEVALADAVIALTSNLAMRQKRRIEFKDEWFDYKSPEVPEGPGPNLAQKA
jgi:predicted dehydrogenase